MCGPPGGHPPPATRHGHACADTVASGARISSIVCLGCSSCGAAARCFIAVVADSEAPPGAPPAACVSLCAVGFPPGRRCAPLSAKASLPLSTMTISAPRDSGKRLFDFICVPPHQFPLKLSMAARAAIAACPAPRDKWPRSACYLAAAPAYPVAMVAQVALAARLPLLLLGARPCSCRRWAPPTRATQNPASMQHSTASATAAAAGRAC